MRHSSWTLFLVPLTLPLVFLCIPGSMRSPDQSDPVAEEAYQGLHQENPSHPEVPGLSFGSRDEASGETSEALFRD